ncbi:ABC transporter permease [Flavobacterium sp.]|uniref:ABC transporter permease n=1 Tax=Flavobacterium sp. TaxID=239 RepID=UPI002A7F8FC9|nr:FtsX-like permease family protein [Flavobacterium sp.]
MNFSLYIAKRYFLSFSKNSSINIITGIASIGIIASSMALLIVLCVFSGLRDFSLSFTNASDPDLKMFPKSGKTIFITPEQEEKLQKSPYISNYSKTVEERVLFYYNEKEHVAYLKGVDSLFTKSNTFSNQLYTGDWLESETPQVVVGYEISRKLSLGLFDFNNGLEVFSPKPGKGIIENPDDAFNKTVLQPVGIYAVNEEIDNKYVFCDITISQKLLGYKKNQVSSIEFKKNDNISDEDVITELNTIFKNKGDFKTRIQLNDALYKMLNTENIAVYLIFTLVIIIALFNLVGALIMMIIDKKANLKTLYNIGTPIEKLQSIFLFQGTLLTLFGGLIGTILGVLIVWIQQQYDVVMITPTLPYPVILKLKNIGIVLMTILFLGIFASWIASTRVNKNLFQ